MGIDEELMNVVFDTGSDWLAVEGKGCKNCLGNLYDGSKGTKVG